MLYLPGMFASRRTFLFTANVPKPEFIEPENWPSNSPDLNPIDYSIWGALQQLSAYKIFETRIIQKSANELLGTDRTGLNRQSDRLVADQNFTGYAS